MKKTDCRTTGRFVAVCSAGAFAMSVACAALGQTCIISGTQEHTAADSESSLLVSAFDSGAIAAAAAGHQNSVAEKHDGERDSFGPLSPSARPSCRRYLWPEGKMPDAQPHQVAAKWEDTKKRGFDPAANRRPFIEWYSPASSNRTDICVVTVSGGGFMMTCDAERLQPAIDRLVAAGITVADVTYRTPRPEGLPIHQSAWQDVQRALRIVRHEAVKRGYSPSKIGATGISAGAKAVLLVATDSGTRAYDPVDGIDDVPANLDFAVLQAPAYVLSDGTEGINTRGGDGADIEIVPELRFDPKTCPMCFLHGGVDGVSPLGSTRLFRKLRELGIPAALHIFADRWHGFHGDQNRGDDGESHDHWWDRAMEFIKPPEKGEKLDPRWATEDPLRIVISPAEPLPENPDASERCAKVILHESQDRSAVNAVISWERFRRLGIQCDLHVAGARGPVTWRGRIREFKQHIKRRGGSTPGNVH